jgi:hypothetical protein
LKNILKNIVSEPLLHFLLLGSLIYVYYTFTQQTQNTSQNKSLIIVNKQDIQHLSTSFTSKLSQKPTPVIVNALIQKDIQDKILVNEAYALGLDKENPQTKDALQKKMNFIINAESNIQEPSETQLKEYYFKNKQDYSVKTSFSLYFIHFDHQLKDSQNNYFYKLLPFIEKEKIAKKINNKSRQWLKKEFGNYFVQQLLLMKKGFWSKAIYSKNGMEFVYITKYLTTTPLPFDDVQERVYNDYKNERRKQNYDKIYTTFRNTYSVHVTQ